MLNKNTIAVVVPCYNEEAQIGLVIETMPKFVDRIIIVDDKSIDTSIEVVKKYISNKKFNVRNKILRPAEKIKNSFNSAEMILQQKNKDEIAYFDKHQVINDNVYDRIILIQKERNTGNGKSISIGLKWCKDNNINFSAIMDGDGQMDPDELETILLPLDKGVSDYVKGNRLRYPGAWTVIPKIRFIGNSILSILTKLASGFWSVSDTQTGFIAFSLKALNSIKLYNIYGKYGWPNDILIKLNIAYCTIKEVTIKPVYSVGEKSKMNIFKVVFPISWLLFKGFFKRLLWRYLINGFHPLFILYNMSFFLIMIWSQYLIKVLNALYNNLNLSFETLFAFTFLGVVGFQSLLFAMWMDIQDNDRLIK